MKTEDFEYIATLLKDRSGLVLSQDKQYLLESRLTPLARDRGLASLEDLISAVRKNKDEALLSDITEAMTTNESFFFRDSKPFDRLRGVVLPELLKTRETTKKIRIWCAACSTGQEPYSIAMCLKEEGKKLDGWRVEIIGTDLSSDVLEKAKAGVYSQFEVQRGLPVQMLVKYFAQTGDLWQIDAAIRGMVQYKELNLMDNFAGLGKFDVVFCRNVLIYFGQDLKVDVLNRVGKIMPPDGFLFLGGAETVVGLNTVFSPMVGERGVYRPGGQEALAPAMPKQPASTETAAA